MGRLWVGEQSHLKKSKMENYFVPVSCELKVVLNTF